ncbi:Protein of unknown function [Paraoerskovia marina]|uniref:Uncharacterized protein n=1 Tax=Paraoerskovia marina TaxID=545619 RepID=A0A1H1RSP3_9CELL|nr:DUF3375 domain-containing protein [Paraoerskovia marina]SDS38728.1 Protein of unknown function [Paraoerskovia marina]
MSGARFLGALAGTERAFRMPTLGLLHKQQAPSVVAVLATVFTPERPSVAAEQMYLEVDDLLVELHDTGHEVALTGPARVLCTRWVRERWLVRSLDDGGAEHYQLSSYAAEALAFVDRARGTRALVSESRIRTLVVALEELARDAEPDRDARMRELRGEIDRAEQELGRLEAGGDVVAVEDDRLVEQLDHLLLLVRELPADFARVAEAVVELQREIVSGLRQDERATGTVVEEYLDASETLLERTPEGRAFAGAMELLGDPALLAALDERVAVLLAHDFTADLPPERRAALRGLRTRLVSAIDVVLAAQVRSSRTVTAQIRHHNPLRDRELDRALREATSAMADWFPTSGRAARVEPLRWFERARFGKLRTSLHDLRPETPPDGLDDWTDDGVVDTDAELDGVRAMGGPRHADVDAHLRALGRPTTVAAAFSAGPVALRRPVEILGYLERGAYDDAGSGDVPASHLERVVAVRADGSEREFVVPRVAVTEPTTGDEQ